MAWHERVEPVAAAHNRAAASPKEPSLFLFRILHIFPRTLDNGTDQIGKVPVTTVAGHAYERVAIECWLCTHDTDPMTNEVLPSKELVPAIALRQLIEQCAATDGAAP